MRRFRSGLDLTSLPVGAGRGRDGPSGEAGEGARSGTRGMGRAGGAARRRRRPGCGGPRRRGGERRRRPAWVGFAGGGRPGTAEDPRCVAVPRPPRGRRGKGRAVRKRAGNALGRSDRAAEWTARGPGRAPATHSERHPSSFAVPQVSDAVLCRPENLSFTVCHCLVAVSTRTSWPRKPGPAQRIARPLRALPDHCRTPAQRTFPAGPAGRSGRGRGSVTSRGGTPPICGP